MVVNLEVDAVLVDTNAMVSEDSDDRGILIEVVDVSVVVLWRYSDV